jgi:histidinol-phosphate aminotransferase
MSAERNLVAPRDDVAALDGYHSPQVEAAVRLNTNESPYPPPPAFLDAWLDDLRSVPIHRYPDRGARALRAALGTYLGQPSERLFCANGSNEVLQTLLLAYGGAGRRALVFEPTYALHSHIARITGTEVAVAERRADFTIDPDAAAARVAREQPSVTFLCSPNNPTGIVESPGVVEAVLSATDGLVVIDEAYGEFASWTATDLVDDGGRLLVARTYSKVWSMAALRLGFCVAPSPVVAELEKVVLPYHLSVPTQLAGVRALRFRAEMDARVSRLVREREHLLAALEDVDGVTPYPSGANFVLFRVTGADPSERAHRVWEQLLARGVLVRSFARWPRLEGSLRVTVGTPDENAAFLAALREAVREVR